MSYVSGFMLGASIGKAVHSFLHGSPQSTVTPGRGFVTAPQNVRTAPPTNCVTPAFACVSSLPVFLSVLKTTLFLNAWKSSWKDAFFCRPV